MYFSIALMIKETNEHQGRTMNARMVKNIEPFSREELEDVLKPVEQATTLPARFYTDPDIYVLEREHILKKSWLCLGHTDQVSEVGDYFTLEVLEEPILVVRDKGDQIRIFSNTCRHRAHPVAEGSGNSPVFTCGFHRWTYNLDGSFRGAPQMEKAEGFNKKDCRLHGFPVENWHGFIFMNFDPDAQPLAPQVKGLDDVFAPYKVSERRYFDSGLSYELDFDWKTSLDIFTESYHTQGVHMNSLQPSIPSKLTTVDETDGLPYTIFRNPPASGQSIDDEDYLMSPNFKEFEGMGEKEREATIISTMFPTFNWFATPDHFFWLKLFPNGPRRNTIGFGVCISEEAAADPKFREKFEKYIEGNKIFLAEDFEACEKIFKGRNSAYYTQGRQSHLEKSTWYFHHWYLSLMMERVPELFED